MATLLSLATCGAADNPVAGKWDCLSTDERGTEQAWVLEVKGDADKLSASLVGGMHGDVIPLLDPKLRGSTFTFKVRINDEETVGVSVKIDGKKFEGKFKSKSAGTGSFKGSKQE
jgi:hypothetical protein